MTVGRGRLSGYLNAYPMLFQGGIFATINTMTHRVVIDTNLFVGARLSKVRHIGWLRPVCVGNTSR